MNRDHSLINSLLRLCFPHDAPWQRRKKMRLLLLAVLTGVLIGVAIMGIALLMTYNR